MKLIEKIEQKLTSEDFESKSPNIDLIIDLCMLIMSLTDKQTDPAPSIRNLSALILQKYSVHSENVNQSFVQMMMYWHKVAEQEISIAANEEIIGYVLQLK